MPNHMLMKDRIKNDSNLMDYYDAIQFIFRSFLYQLSPKVLVQYLYISNVGKIPNLTEPRTFDEKLLWLMLYWKHPLKITCSDKYAVRFYIHEHGLSHILPNLLGVYNSSDQIDYNGLPRRFVLKCTHGSRMNIICKDKEKLDIQEANRKLDTWLTMDISKLGGESHYAMIPPRIICEEYLENLADCSTNDYKVFCFGGRAHCTMACTNRGSGSTQFDFYDRDWVSKLPYGRSSLLANRDIPKPEAYSQIIDAAERLSKPFPFVRADFYSINGKAVFGEMTFTPNGCIDTGYTELAQEELGKLLELPI